MEISELSQRVLPFDLGDFIARVSSLRVLFENQDKAILFDALEKEVLKESKPAKEIKPRMSPNLFAQIIHGLESSSLAPMIDPPEYPFAESVFVPDEKHLFQGINSAQAYYLQHLFDTLSVEQSGLDPAFIKEAKQIIHAISSLSECFFRYLNVSLQNTIDYQKNESVVMGGPNPDLFRIPDPIFASFFGGSFAEVRPWLFYDSKSEGDDDIFHKPFFAQEGQVIVIDSTALGDSALHIVFSLAEQKGQLVPLINVYNALCWQQALLDLWHLTGAKRIRSSSLAEAPSRDYKTALFKSSDGNCLAVIGFFDDGNHYESISVASGRPVILEKERANRGLKSLQEIIQKNAIDPRHLYAATILFGFGRMFQVESNVTLAEKRLVIGAQDLSYLPANERNDKRFLFDYLDLKNATIKSSPFSSFFGDMYSIASYSENHHSFYCNDDVNIRNSMITFAFDNGYSYKSKSRLNSPKCLVPHPFFPNAGVLVEKDVRNIYSWERATFIGEVAVFTHFVLWVYFDIGEVKNEETADCLYLVVDTITYWLSEFEDVFADSPPQSIHRIHLIFNSDQASFFSLSAHDSEMIVQVAGFDRWPNAKNNDNNQDEKDLMMALLKALNVPAETLEKAGSCFSNPKKKKNFETASTLGPYLVSDSPTGPDPIYPSAAYEERILDDLGEVLNDKVKKGLIAANNGNQLLDEAIHSLYERLAHETAAFDRRSLLEATYQNVEKAASALEFLRQDKTHAILLYPENDKEIVHRFYVVSSASACSHALLEFVAAVGSEGTEKCTAYDVGNLLAIIDEICSYGNEWDLIHCHLCEDGVHLLNSGRLEIKSSVQEKIRQINEDFSLLEETSEVPSIEHGFDPALKNDVDPAFEEGYGFTFQNLQAIIECLLKFDSDRKKVVKKAKAETVLDYLSAGCSSIPRKVIETIIDSLTSKKRRDFFDPAPLPKRETYPWLTNRMLSILRRPLVAIDNEIWWGNESLLLTELFHFNLLSSGTERTPFPSKKMEALKGRVIAFFGNDFNDKIFKRIESFDGFLAYKNITKFGKRYLRDEHGQDIGDIDVLAACPKEKKIFVIETKCYRRAINPLQMSEEMTKVFGDNEASMLNKHKRRYHWVQDHRDLLSSFFSAYDDSWEIIPLMVTSSLLISCPFSGIKENIISAKELTPQYFSRLHQ